jgi:predicted enzyme related to lactoylglutathione lyase
MLMRCDYFPAAKESTLRTEQAAAKVEKLGGKLVLSKRPEGQHGLFCNVVDVEGNRFGLYQIAG